MAARRFSGQLLRAHRTRIGMSREGLADRVHRSLWTVVCWEKGRTTPSVTMCAQVADVLGVGVDDLLVITDDDPRGVVVDR
ncbi:MAG: helix-turn-helix transcriptional regulator [Stackebrandtia sp.]